MFATVKGGEMVPREESENRERTELDIYGVKLHKNGCTPLFWRSKMEDVKEENSSSSLGYEGGEMCNVGIINLELFGSVVLLTECSFLFSGEDTLPVTSSKFKYEQ